MTVKKVTRADVYAARARVSLNKRLKRPTEGWVQRLAETSLETQPRDAHGPQQDRPEEQTTDIDVVDSVLDPETGSGQFVQSAFRSLIEAQGSTLPPASHAATLAEAWSAHHKPDLLILVASQWRKLQEAPIEELGLNVRLYNQLKRSQIDNYLDLVLLQEKKLDVMLEQATDLPTQVRARIDRQLLLYLTQVALRSEGDSGPRTFPTFPTQREPHHDMDAPGVGQSESDRRE